ncbi:MAG TPA: DUF3551 domain-containing protein [Xanthobacteraceae bacterium]|jgi:hypothetical protein
MHRALIASSVLVAALVGSVQPSRAAPFCMATDLYGGEPDCSYYTWASCRAAVLGVGRYCFTNTAAGYIFDSREPANPRVIGRKPPRKFWPRH